MKRLFVPTDGVAAWRALLADPRKHWKRGASAMELAASWERVASTERGLPLEVADVLDRHKATRGGRLVFGFPEHKVALKGGSRASQTDLWAVLGVRKKWVSVAVEGKAKEPFGPTVDEWLQGDGKRERLDALCATLGQPRIQASPLRYQLFHRAASAVIEAKRIGARTAVLLVQSFYKTTESWSDFQPFVEQFGVEACRGGICDATCPDLDRLLFAWVDSEPMTNAEFAALNKAGGLTFPTHIPLETDRAYRETTFTAATDAGEIAIRVGEHQPALDPLLAAAGVKEWAFVTASNPYPQQLSDAENIARNEALRIGLMAGGFTVLPGRGDGPDGKWSEESFLVLGISRDAALAVARNYGQAAIVVGRLKELTKLEYC